MVCRNADMPSMHSRMLTVRNAHGAKTRNSIMPPDDLRPFCSTIDHSTSDNSAIQTLHV